MNLKQQRQLTLGATQAVADFWAAQAAQATDPDVATYCRDQGGGAKRAVEQLTALVATTDEATPGAPLILPPPHVTGGPA